MPRLKVSALDRRRVSRACVTCRRRKEKCDGDLPCKHCKSRNKEDLCAYTPSRPRTSDAGHSGKRRRLSSPSPLHEATGSNGTMTDLAIEIGVEAETPFDEVAALLGLSSASHAQHSSAQQAAASPILDSAPITKQERMLRDGKGKFIYIGESASLSYLQIVRRTAADCIGSCKFTVDPLQHQMMEKDITGHLGSHLEPTPEPELAWCLALVEQFELAISGFLDLFDAAWLETLIAPWIADPKRRDRPESPIIYLVLATGALARSRDIRDDEAAEQYFNYGRQLSVIHLMDDPSLLTVQAFSLASYYMIASCRRNGAFTNLGIAARAAYSLGIHRHETNTAFARETGIARERAWKSLRVCDLFLSASMGRPPATSEIDCNIPYPRLEKSNDRDTSSVSSQAASAIFRICHIFQRILVEVYSNRIVSLDLARSISQQHREWTTELPSMLKIDGLLKNETTMSATVQKLGSHIVIMAYYYSIILLSRPFLSFHVSTRLRLTGRTQDAQSQPDSITTYANACVDSAIKGVALAKEIAFDELMPKRQPIIINTVFISALCLGHAYFGDYDQRGWPVGTCLDTAISILRHFSHSNPQSARYHEICCHMKDAIGAYVQKRADTLLRSTSLHVKSVFGDAQQAISPSPPVDVPGSSRTHTTADSGVDIHLNDAPSISAAFSDGYNFLSQDSMITTDGIFAGNSGEPHGIYNPDFLSEHVATEPHASTSFADGFSFRDDAPLFSLMDQLGTPSYNDFFPGD